jgi:DNA-binding protein H-NS
MAQMSQAVAQLASNLDTLNSNDLKELRFLVDQRIKAAEVREVNQAREQIKAIADRVGLPLSEILGTKGMSASNREPLPAKYRNPENANETWTGRGARPKWVSAALASGKQLEQLAVKS